MSKTERIAEALDGWRADLAPTTPQEKMRADLAEAAALLRSEPQGDREERDKEMFKRGWDAAKDTLPVGEPVACATRPGFDALRDYGERTTIYSIRERQDGDVLLYAAPPAAPEAQEPERNLRERADARFDVCATCGHYRGEHREGLGCGCVVVSGGYDGVCVCGKFVPPVSASSEEER